MVELTFAESDGYKDVVVTLKTIIAADDMIAYRVGHSRNETLLRQPMNVRPPTALTGRRRRNEDGLKVRNRLDVHESGHSCLPRGGLYELPCYTRTPVPPIAAFAQTYGIIK